MLTMLNIPYRSSGTLIYAITAFTDLEPDRLLTSSICLVGRHWRREGITEEVDHFLKGPAPVLAA